MGLMIGCVQTFAHIVNSSTVNYIKYVCKYVLYFCHAYSDALLFQLLLVER